MLEKREILFRAKRLCEITEWAYGYYIKNYGDEGTIANHETGEQWTVNHLTLCQYTGIKDCEGKRIFEGDIVEVDWEGERREALVWFSDGSFLYEIAPSFSFHLADADNPKIIGNIFKNDGD